MSVYVYAIVSPALDCGTPASDLDGERWTFSAASRADADARAERRLDQTFAYASAERVAATSLRFVAEFPSMQSYRAAEESAA